MANQTYLKNLKTPIAIIGLGKSGLSALRLLKSVGFLETDILTYDDKDQSANFNDPAAISKANPSTLVVSPGVPLSTSWIQSLVQGGCHLTSEISLAASTLTTEKVIGITGSVGKSTVTSILGVGVKADNENNFVGGNLGTPFCDYAATIISGKAAADWIILELSSYQLENAALLKLEFSAITFLSPNHMERYSGLQHYYDTKLKITAITKKLCVVNQSSPDAVAASTKASCPVKLVNAKSTLKDEEIKKVALIGQHNHDNFAVAQVLAKNAGLSNEATEKMYHFKGLPHRLENVGTVNGVTYVNDSKATAMDSVLVATFGCLEKVSEKNLLYLLLGGKDKNLPWEQLSILKEEKKIHFIFFGACGEIAKEKSKLSGEPFKTLNAALDYCLSIEKPGDMVLLSPGGTSLDEFKNFEERGHFFTKKVIRFAK